MKSLKIVALALIVLAVGFYSCKKEADTTVTSDAVIRNGDNINGCGFLMVVQLNNGTYSPTNLTAEFKPLDSIKVRVTYRLLDTYHACTNVAGGYQEAQLTSITKIN